MEVAVVSHEVEGSGTTLNQHRWTIRVCLQEPDHEYLVSRSYTEFVLLDELLKKKSPNSDLISLPFDDKDKNIVTKIVKPELKEATHAHTQRRETISPEKIKASHAVHRASLSNSAKFIAASSTDLESYESLLNQYLQKILLCPELLLSEELLNFLDEVEDFFAGPSEYSPVTLHDVLFGDIETKSITIPAGKIERINVPVESDGGVILYSFSSDMYDIGFSVEVDNNIRLPFSRMNSHVKDIKGSIKVNYQCTATLVFDNSYAKMRKKQLYFKCIAIDKDRIPQAMDQILSIERDHRMMSHRRLALHETVSEMCKNMCGVSTLFVSQLELSSASNERELDRLREQHHLLQNEVSQLRETNISQSEQIRVLQSYESKFNETTTTLEEVKTTTGTLEVELERAKMRRASLEKDRDQSWKQVVALEASYNEKETEVETLKDEKLATALLHKQTISKLESELAEIKSFNKTIKDDLKKQKDILYNSQSFARKVEENVKALNLELAKSF